MTTRLWHYMYCRWYDHHTMSHRIRATLWGHAADRLANHA